VPDLSSIKVILFSKIPLAGFAKTRLSKEIGEEKAMQIFKCLLKVHAANYESLQNKYPAITFEAHLAFPDKMSYRKAKSTFISSFPFKCEYFAQGPGGLKTRMIEAMQKSQISDLTILHGSDVAGLKYSHFLCSILQPELACIAPSNDGGYGFISCPAGFLDNNLFPETGKADTLSELLNHLQHHGIPSRIIASVFDLDTYEDCLSYKSSVNQASNFNSIYTSNLALMDAIH
jgi:glycosyltransferase A (GT-A) superfamily protein (DUF2064 family)